MRLKHELFTNNCNFKKFDNHLKLLYNIENKKEVNQMRKSTKNYIVPELVVDYLREYANRLEDDICSSTHRSMVILFSREKRSIA